jgi:hypothetical protein
MMVTGSFPFFFRPAIRPDAAPPGLAAQDDFASIVFRQ